MEYKVEIKKSDESIYWIEKFNTLEAAQAWLATEQTRPYWDATYTYTITDVTPVPTTEELRSNKLNSVRSMRAPYLTEIDLYVNELALNDCEYTQEQIKVYRRAWLDITNPYKADPTLLDNLDIETIVKPVIVSE